MVNLILSFFLVFRFDKGNVLCGKTGYPETYNYNKFDASLIKIAFNRACSELEAMHRCWFGCMICIICIVLCIYVLLILFLLHFASC